MGKTIFGVEVYALMWNKEVIGYFAERDGKLVLDLLDGMDINKIPYMLRLNYKENLEEAMEKWVSSRLLQKDRMGLKFILTKWGISKYNKHDLFLHSHASMMKDAYWVAFSESDTYEECTQRGLMNIEPQKDG